MKKLVGREKEANNETEGKKKNQRGKNNPLRRGSKSSEKARVSH